MSQKHIDPIEPADLAEESAEDLERLLIQGVHFDSQPVPQRPSPVISPSQGEEEENGEVPTGGDQQGALGLFAEAAQDMATASLELSLGRHFACADFCNQAAEKAAQAVSLLRFGRRSPYNHDLRALALLVGAPQKISDEMAILTPFHPEAFYADTPPEEADEVITAEQAAEYVQHARNVIRWARGIILHS